MMVDEMGTSLEPMGISLAVDGNGLPIIAYQYIEFGLLFLQHCALPALILLSTITSMAIVAKYPQGIQTNYFVAVQLTMQINTHGKLIMYPWQ